MIKPKIRFKGYQEEWEQRKLGDMAEFSKGSGYSKGDLIESGTPIILYGRLYTKYETIISDVDTFVEAKDGSVYSKGGEVIVPASGETAEDIARAASVDKSGILLGGDLNVVMPNEDINSAFLAISISNGSLQRELARKAQGKSVVHIHNEEIRNLIVPFPTKAEQNKMENYFAALDHFITLHHRKCEETKILKKYMLQKMFPQNGNSVPEIRFWGFTEDWEQRKLGDLVDRVTRKNQDLVSELPLTISAQYGLIDQNEFFDKRVASKDVSGYYLIENGEFAYNKSTSTDAPWGAIKRLDRYENGVLSTLYIVFGIKENNPVYSDFLVSYYSTNLWHKGIHEIAAEGARNHGLLNIAPADFFETKLKIPQDIEEQKKIGKYFEELERLITLHHRKSNIFIREWDFVWEQRKLGEVIEGVSKKNTDGLYTQDDILACSLGTELDRKTIFYGLRSTEDSVKSYRIVNIGNVIYTKSPIKGYPNGIVRTCKIVDGIVPSLYCVYKKKENISIPIDTRFIQSYLEDKGRLAQYLCPLVNVGARNNVNITDKEFLEGVIKIPMTVEEQTKIVDALEKINHLITLHHRKQICVQMG